MATSRNKTKRELRVWLIHAMRELTIPDSYIIDCVGISNLDDFVVGSENVLRELHAARRDHLRSVHFTAAEALARSVDALSRFKPEELEDSIALVRELRQVTSMTRDEGYRDALARQMPLRLGVRE